MRAGTEDLRSQDVGSFTDSCLSPAVVSDVTILLLLLLHLLPCPPQSSQRCQNTPGCLRQTLRRDNDWRPYQVTPSFVYHPDNYGNLVKNGPQSRQPLSRRMCIGVRPGGEQNRFQNIWSTDIRRRYKGGVKYRIFHSWLLSTILSFWISSALSLKTYRPNLQFPIEPNNPEPSQSICLLYYSYSAVRVPMMCGV